MAAATERYADWSPASVFGATTTPEPPVENSRNACGSFRDQSPENSIIITHESWHCVPSSAPCPDDAVPKRRASTAVSVSVPAQQELARRKSTFAAREIVAAHVIARRVRLVLLRRREQETLHQVSALRSMLEAAAVSMLVRSFRSYSCRRRIQAYLAQWQQDEIRVGAVLRSVATKKRRLEAHVASIRRERLQQRHAEAATRVMRWYRRSVDRRRRQSALVAVAHASQRKIARWYRSTKLLQQRLQQEGILLDRRTRAVRLIQLLCRRRQRWRLESASAARRIQLYWRQAKLMQAARNKLSRCRHICSGVGTLTALVHIRETRLAFFKWLAVTRFLQQETQQCNTSARVLQHAYRAMIARRHQQKVHTSALSLQRAVRGHRARRRCHQLRTIAKRKREQRAATRIQSQARGFLARVRFAKLLKQLRDRFRCANCGVIEPSGAYCKLCGRKRTTFDLVLSPRHGAHISTFKALERRGVSCKAAIDVVHQLQFKMAPTRPPASPPSTSFAMLQAAKNGNIRRFAGSSSHTQVTKSTAISVSDSGELQVIARLDSLPMVLSPRHIVQNGGGGSALRKRPQRHVQSDAASISNQTESHLPPLPAALARPEPPKTVAQTKLRAQALTKLQTHQQQQQQLQQANHTPAQHMHRLQKDGLAASRSR